MRDSELFQAELGRIEADLKAARAYLQVQAASHWRHALNGTLKRVPFLTQIRELFAKSHIFVLASVSAVRAFTKITRTPSGRQQSYLWDSHPSDSSAKSTALGANIEIPFALSSRGLTLMDPYLTFSSRKPITGNSLTPA